LKEPLSPKEFKERLNNQLPEGIRIKDAKEILINAGIQEKRVAVVSDGLLEEFYIERPQDKTIVGNIYKGKIEAVMPSVGAAFVDIGLIKKGFLYLSEIESALSLQTRLSGYCA